MGYIVVFVLHLFCGMAAMAGVHSQDYSTSGNSDLYQEFEGDAMRSIRQSWIDAGTNSSWLTDKIWWSLKKHPCYLNTNQYKPSIPWLGVQCDSKLFQQNASTSINTYHFLTDIFLVGFSKRYNDGNRVDTAELVGGLPSAILNLTNLRSLKIADATKLSGTLPPGIFCHLNNLKTMELINCSFNGSLSIGFTPGCDTNYALEYLDLSWNSFTSMNLGEFEFLQYLNISNNQLKGEVSLSGSTP